jgi:hypothetical protein
LDSKIVEKHMKINALKLFARLFPLFWFATSIWAQSASLNGLVLDPAAATVPSAAIRVVQTQTNVARTTQSDSGGGYQVSNLPPGEYKIVVEKTGFDKLERGGIILSVDTATRVDLKLQTGGVRQALTVSEEAPGIQLNNAEMATDITAKQSPICPSRRRAVSVARPLSCTSPRASRGTFASTERSTPVQRT